MSGIIIYHIKIIVKSWYYSFNFFLGFFVSEFCSNFYYLCPSTMLGNICWSVSRFLRSVLKFGFQFDFFSFLMQACCAMSFPNNMILLHIDSDRLNHYSHYFQEYFLFFLDFLFNPVVQNCFVLGFWLPHIGRFHRFFFCDQILLSWQGGR